MGETTEVEIIGIRQWREARSESVGIGAPEGVVSGNARHVEVIVDDHDIADVVVRVEAAGGIGDDQRLDIEKLEDANGESCSLDGVAFVETSYHAESVNHRRWRA